MNRIKFLQILSLALLIINILLVVFLMTRKPPGHKKMGPKDMVVKQLGLTPDQITSYEVTILNHQEKTRQTDEQIRKLKKELYTGLGSDMTTEEQEVIVAKLSILQQKIELGHLQHFREIKALCTPDQLPKYKELSTNLARFFSVRPPKHKKK